MTPESLRDHLRQRPFVPFRVCLSDGMSYEVHRPDSMLVMQQEALIALLKPGEEIARRAVHCNLSLITGIEPLNGRTQSKTGN